MCGGFIAKKEIWTEIRGYIRILLVGTYLINLINSSARTLSPILFSLAINAVEEKQEEYAAQLMLGWIGVRGVSNLLSVLNELLISYIHIDFTNKMIGGRFVKKIHTINFNDLGKHCAPDETSSLLDKFTQQTNLLLSRMVNNFVPTVIDLILASIVLNVNLSLSTSFSPLATALLWIYSLYNLLMSAGIAYCQRNILEKTRGKLVAFNKVLTEDLRGMETIRIYRQNPLHAERERRLFDVFTTQILNNTIAPAWLKFFFIKAMFLLACLASFFIVGGRVFNMPVGRFDELVLLINYLILFHGSTESLGSSVLDINAAVDLINKVEKFLTLSDEKLSVGYLTELNQAVDKKQLIVGQQQPFSTTPDKPVIEFVNVSVTLGDFSLRNVSFKIEAGKSCALVGESGSGKSTIIQLLCGIYQPTSGKIYIYGQDIVDIHTDELRLMLTLINQGAELFNEVEKKESRLAYNVLFGHSNSSVLKRIGEKARLTLAELNELEGIREKAMLPRSLQNEIPKPSGGQRQRIGLARGWRKTPIIILDEPTSALDVLTEKAVIENFNMLLQDKTPGEQVIDALIVTAHRLKTIQHFDQILVLENGLLVEDAGLNHDALMTKHGKYFEYYTAQENTPSFSMVCNP